MDKLRIGIIGTGGIAHAHMGAYKNRNDIEIVALCDIIPGKAEAFAKEFGIEGAKFYENHEEMLDKETLDKQQIEEIFAALRLREPRPAWTGSARRAPDLRGPIPVPARESASTTEQNGHGHE